MWKKCYDPGGVVLTSDFSALLKLELRSYILTPVSSLAGCLTAHRCTQRGQLQGDCMREFVFYVYRNSISSCIFLSLLF